MALVKHSPDLDILFIFPLEFSGLLRVASSLRWVSNEAELFQMMTETVSCQWKASEKNISFSVDGADGGSVLVRNLKRARPRWRLSLLLF